MPEDAQPAATPKISAADWEKIQTRNLKNALRKLESGKTLTAAEMRILDAARGVGAGAGVGGSGAGAGGPGTAISPKAAPSSYASMGQAAAALNLPLARLKWAKRQGCPAFRANRVYRTELIDWLSVHGHEYGEGRPLFGIEAKKEEEVAERIRKLKLKNDHDEGLLLKRAWITERMARAAGELAAQRARSEAEHPLLFAACGTNVDVVKCRTVVRGIWDDIMKSIQALGKHFAEGSDRKSA